MRDNSTLPIKIQLPNSFYEEEVRSDYFVSVDTKALWAVLLDLLVEYDRVCRKHDITYYLDGGTLLGAVRHKGFIPWDNDIDVIMTRTEYNRLCKVADEEFSMPYFWQTSYTDLGSARRHGQLRNARTTAILTSEMEDGKATGFFNQGVFMDIFILDEVPDDETELILFRDELQQTVNVLWELKTLYNRTREDWVGMALTQEMHRLDKLSSRYNGKGMSRQGNISFNPKCKDTNLFRIETHGQPVMLEFEGFYFPCPSKYDDVLTGLYGDWKQFVKGTENHGGMKIDLDLPYTEYLHQGKYCYDIHPLIDVYTKMYSAWKDCDTMRGWLEQYKTDNENIQRVHTQTSLQYDRLSKMLESVIKENTEIKASKWYKMYMISKRIRTLFSKLVSDVHA